MSTVYVICHGASGRAAKNHKYVTREWKNGRWVYTYPDAVSKKRVDSYYDRLDKEASKAAANTGRTTGYGTVRSAKQMKRAKAWNYALSAIGNRPLVIANREERAAYNRAASKAVKTLKDAYTKPASVTAKKKKKAQSAYSHANGTFSK